MARELRGWNRHPERGFELVIDWTCLHREHWFAFHRQMQERYGRCKLCGNNMQYLMEVHTFACACGHRDWFAERINDHDQRILFFFDEKRQRLFVCFGQEEADQFKEGYGDPSSLERLNISV